MGRTLSLANVLKAKGADEARDRKEEPNVVDGSKHIIVKVRRETGDVATLTPELEDARAWYGKIKNHVRDEAPAAKWDLWWPAPALDSKCDAWALVPSPARAPRKATPSLRGGSRRGATWLYSEGNRTDEGGGDREDELAGWRGPAVFARSGVAAAPPRLFRGAKSRRVPRG